VLDARQGGPHRLLAGSGRVPAPAYDLAGVLARSPGAAAAPATLGPSRANPAFQLHEAPLPFTERHRGLLGAGLLVVLAGLGAFTLRLMKRAA
jgi:hypothetical protein